MTKKKQPATDIRAETTAWVGVGALEAYIEILQTAFKAEGIQGVVQCSLEFVKFADATAAECDKQGLARNLTEGIVSGRVLNEWHPAVIAAYERAAAAQG